MAIIITPTYPISGELVSLALDNATGNAIVYELTVVPDDSLLPPSVQERLATGRRIQDAVDDESATAEFTPDEPGTYSFRAYEYTDSPGSAAFSGDPAGQPFKRFLVDQSTTVHVGAILELPLITASGDGATLRIQINDDMVRAASLLNFRTNAAESAAEQSVVVASLAALVGTSVAGIGGTLTANVAALRSAYSAHIEDTVPHDNSDSVNTVP